jgi:hypothetical protein
MYCKSREETIRVIEIIREESCSYMGDMCDCKYGFQGKSNQGCASESTGCPELRTVLTLLKNMTNEEYTEILKRTNNIVSEELIQYIEDMLKR